MEAEYEAGLDELYKEFKQQYEDEYVFEQIHDYYKANSDIAKEPLEFLEKSKLLISYGHYTPGFLLSTISMEVGIKVIILKPVLFSLAFDKTAGELLYDSTFKQKSVPHIPKLYYRILRDYTGFDFNEYILTDSKIKLWDELSDLQKLRNEIIHQAKTVGEKEAEESVKIANGIYREVIPTILDKFQFHLKNDRIEYGSLGYSELINRKNQS